MQSFAVVVGQEAVYMHGVVGRHQEHNRRKYDDADEAQESEEPPGLENKGLFGFIFFS